MRIKTAVLLMLSITLTGCGSLSDNEVSLMREIDALIIADRSDWKNIRYRFGDEATDEGMFVTILFTKPPDHSQYKYLFYFRSNDGDWFACNNLAHQSSPSLQKHKKFYVDRDEDPDVLDENAVSAGGGE